MKRLNLIILITFLIGCCCKVYSQDGYIVKGKVINAADDRPLEMVNLGIKELNLWTCSDVNGEYILKNIPAGTYTLQASYVGFELYNQKLVVPMKGQNIIKMVATSLELDEIVVVAKEGKKLTSTTEINSSTLEHIQATDLTDVMQLMPGNITMNPKLNDPKQFAIREIVSPNKSADAMAGLGTQIIIDGAPISNDANLQVTSTANVVSGNIIENFSTSASSGVDTRNIAVENIESIEVVRGIASAEYGDVLSGIVKVNLKKGFTPWSVKAKFDPSIKQFYLGKGIKLPKEGGALNFDVDFLKSLDDPRFPYKTFYRLNGSVIYSNTFFKQTKPLNLNFSANFWNSTDSHKHDPDMLKFEDQESTDKNLSLGLSGKWYINSKFLTSLNYNFSGNIQHQLNKVTKLENKQGVTAYFSSLVSGEFEGQYLPTRYISEYTIDGQPYYLDGRLTGIKTFSISNNGFNNLKIGLEYKLNGNKGEGRNYTSEYPPSLDFDRARSYKDIPAMHQIAYYLEDELALFIGNTKLDLQAGLRFTNLQPDNLFISSVNNTQLDPRFNLKYTILNKESKSKGLNLFDIRFGYGLFSKSPTLLHFYPDKKYADRVSFNYYDLPNRLLVGTTLVIDDTRNYDLKSAINKKIETGFDLKIGNVDIMITGFYENMKNGFTLLQTYRPFIFNVYDKIPAGLAPYYLPGIGVAYNDPLNNQQVLVPYTKDTIWISYSYPTNSKYCSKKGIEYSIDLGEIRPLRTSFIVDGAYLWVKKQDMADYLDLPSGNYLGDQHPYVGLYPGGKGDINQRFNTNIRIITHIKELRMVVTLTTQIIWFEKKQNIYEDENGNVLIYTKIPVNNVYEEISQIKYVNPYGYFDHSNSYHIFDPSSATHKPLSDLIINSPTTYSYASLKYPFLHQINLKLTKEISKNINLSFYVNNFTNYRPLQNLGFDNYTRSRNDNIYFGAELKVKI